MKKIKMIAHGTNIPLPVGNGKLTLCALDDFRDTLRAYHTVVTLCKYKPTYPIGCENENHHSYFRAFVDGEDKWQVAIELVEELLSQGKDVLLHCIHGKDRTGGVAYVVLRNTGKTHSEACTILNKIRPRMALEWQKIMQDRQVFHESLIRPDRSECR